MPDSPEPRVVLGLVQGLLGLDLRSWCGLLLVPGEQSLTGLALVWWTWEAVVVRIFVGDFPPKAGPDHRLMGQLQSLLR